MCELVDFEWGLIKSNQARVVWIWVKLYNLVINNMFKLVGYVIELSSHECFSESNALE